MTKRLIVGLGNPSQEYARTRHNFGAWVVRRFVEVSGKEALQAAGVATLLPSVNMNDSGRPVAEFLRQSSLTPAHVILVHDELELPLGEWRFQEGGGARGHNGVRSVQAT